MLGMELILGGYRTLVGPEAARRAIDMDTNIFRFKPAQVPKAVRGTRRSRYAGTVEAVYHYMQEHKDATSVKVELGDTGVKSAVAGFRNAIARSYPDSLRLVQRGGEIYITKRQ
jgi:hypothetical protein